MVFGFIIVLFCRSLLAAPVSIDSFCSGDAILTAEIYWALTVVDNHYSFKSLEDTSTLFTKMFPDNPIASKFTCGEKKCSYFTTFGIAPYVQELLALKLKSAGVSTTPSACSAF